MQFGDRLASERKRLGYRGADFGVACGVTGASQSLYENGKRSPDAEYLMKACALGADPMFLLIGTPAPAGALHVADDEKAPLVAFHGLSPKARKAMMALVEAVKDER
jgi:transcriptional regulator with XRE-family HTH domain